MSFSHYPLSDRVVEQGVVKNLFSFFNIIQLSKFKLVDTTWNAFIDNNFLNVDAAVTQKMQRVGHWLRHFNLYYDKNGGFILDILKSTCGIHRDGDKNELISVLGDDLPFLWACNQELDFLSDNMYFWSPDGIVFYQMQLEIGPCSELDAVSATFRTDEHHSASDSCCKVRFSERDFKKVYTRYMKASVLDSMSQPVIEFDRCPDHYVNLFLQFIMQNKIRMTPLVNRLNPVCLIQFGNNDDLLLIARKKSNGQYFLKIREKDKWRDQPCGYSISFPDNKTILRIPFENNHGCKAIIISLNSDFSVAQCEIELIDDSKQHINPMPLPEEEALSGMHFLHRGVNPRFTPLRLLTTGHDDENELQESPQKRQKMEKF